MYQCRAFWFSVLSTLRRQPPFSLLITNASFDSQADGLKIVRQLRQGNPAIAVILLANQSSEDLAIAALKARVNDYFKVPFSYAELLASVRRCLDESVPPSASLLQRDEGTLPSGIRVRPLKSCTGRVSHCTARCGNTTWSGKESHVTAPPRSRILS